MAESDDAGLVGYLVCRVDGSVIETEALYASPAYRRQGIVSSPCAQAERIAQELRGAIVYNQVDPDTGAEIRVLSEQGYTVLSLIELRRARPGGEPVARIRVGSHNFFP